MALGLPLLDAMIPAATAFAQTTAVPPRRFFAGFVPHGAAPGHWVPDKVGSLGDHAFPFIYRPLEPYRKYVTILSGLHATSSEPPPGETGADHWVAAAFLCAEKPKKTAGADVRAGHTIDQVIAQKIGRETLLPSVEMSVEDPGSGSSNCGEGYSCVYTNTIAWASPTTPLPMELNPQVVFERMFGSGSTPEQRAARRARNQSILDSVNDKIGKLRQEISVPDRARLDSFTENVREIERRLAIAADATQTAPEDIEVPPGIPQSFDQHIKLMFDLLALAWQADVTRVGTMLFARDLTGRRYPESEAPTMGFHGGSHHGEDPATIAEFAKINQYHVKMLAYFVDKLANTEEGDGTLLDHSLVLYGSNMGNPNQHLHYDVPHVIVGANHGRMQGNRHIAYPSRTVPTGNLLLSLLDQFDIHRESFGDSTGRLENI
ncbi:MAG TPA: DUF1552 domain-containing protein [Gammaproteobacteria bacterium]